MIVSCQTTTSAKVEKRRRSERQAEEEEKEKGELLRKRTACLPVSLLLG